MLNLLIVDDEASLRRLLSVLFKKQGYSVQTAEDGEIAVQLIFEGALPLDVMITDHEMPNMRGDEMVKCFRSRGFTGEIIVCSGYLTPDLIRYYLDLGVRKCLTKPVGWEYLRDEVKKIAAGST